MALSMATRPRAESGPVSATLAEVYDLDMGKRTEDLAMWAELVEAAAKHKHGARVVEVGCGRWRIPRLLPEGTSLRGWTAIDPDKAMLEEPVGGFPFEDLCAGQMGEAQDPQVWTRIGPPTLVLIPWSTLYLIPHADQQAVLDHAARALRPGGTLALEVFRPAFTRSRSYAEARTLPGNTGTRVSSYSVDAATKTTRVERLYQMDDGRRFAVNETLYWRDPSEVAAMLAQATGGAPHVRTGEPVPKGSILLTATT